MIILWGDIWLTFLRQCLQDTDGSTVHVPRDEGNPNVLRFGKILQLFDEPVALFL
jgi:hypothetical protein